MYITQQVIIFSAKAVYLFTTTPSQNQNHAGTLCQTHVLIKQYLQVHLKNQKQVFYPSFAFFFQHEVAFSHLN